VLEGSATISMVDYLLRDTGKTTRDIPGFDPGEMVGDTTDSPEFNKAPQAIQDEMLFPYTSGASFVLQLLRTWAGWSDLHKIFDNPPQSTAQIMHPELYLKGVAPVKIDLPPLPKILPKEWKKLDENVMGEFGVRSILKQFLDPDRSADLASAWIGDRYSILERKADGQTLLVMRIALKTDGDAARFFGAYSQVLELKDSMRTNLFRRPNFFSFDTPAGGAFLRCYGSECMIAEGTTRELFDGMTRSIGWPAAPSAPDGQGKGVLAALPPSMIESHLPPVSGASLATNISSAAIPAH